MAGIPQLSSLPGASQTIFLDFDGDTQPVWHRTDSGQTYTNVVAGEFNIDGTPGISSTEEAAIRAIWETVADDYSPFNVNVTTVAPTSFADRVGLRVVMSGDTSATLKTSGGATFNTGIRPVFISNDQGAMVDTSGYAALNSYTNSEPNVVYVFAKYMSTWNTIDSEGRFRDLRAIIANTASHEAGHAFGLEHHGNYDVGTSITTPIMGSNTQGDRTIWSSYTVDSIPVDSIARLTSLLGARPDDYANGIGIFSSAGEFPLNYSVISGWKGTVKGVIGTTLDVDLFRLTTTTTNTYQFTVTVPQFGNLDSQLVLYSIRPGTFGFDTLSQVSLVDPAISTSPFSGLGASLSATLPAGKWAVGVRSHGGYGDLGNYTLTVSIPSSGLAIDPSVLAASNVMVTLVSTTTTTTSNTTTKSGGAGSGAELLLNIVQSDAAKSAVFITETKNDKRSRHELVDDVFAKWP